MCLFNTHFLIKSRDLKIPNMLVDCLWIFESVHVCLLDCLSLLTGLPKKQRTTFVKH